MFKRNRRQLRAAHEGIFVNALHRRGDRNRGQLLQIGDGMILRASRKGVRGDHLDTPRDREGGERFTAGKYARAEHHLGAVLMIEERDLLKRAVAVKCLCADVVKGSRRGHAEKLLARRERILTDTVNGLGDVHARHCRATAERVGVNVLGILVDVISRKADTARLKQDRVRIIVHGEIICIVLVMIVGRAVGLGSDRVIERNALRLSFDQIDLVADVAASVAVFRRHAFGQSVRTNGRGSKCGLSIITVIERILVVIVTVIAIITVGSQNSSGASVAFRTACTAFTACAARTDGASVLISISENHGSIDRLHDVTAVTALTTDTAVTAIAAVTAVVEPTTGGSVNTVTAVTACTTDTACAAVARSDLQFRDGNDFFSNDTASTCAAFAACTAVAAARTVVTVVFFVTVTVIIMT